MKLNIDTSMVPKASKGVTGPAPVTDALTKAQQAKAKAEQAKLDSELREALADDLQPTTAEQYSKAVT